MYHHTIDVSNILYPYLVIHDIILFKRVSQDFFRDNSSYYFEFNCVFRVQIV